MWGSEGSVPGPQTGRGATRKLAANPQRGPPRRQVERRYARVSGSMSLVSPCSGAPDSGRPR